MSTRHVLAVLGVSLAATGAFAVAPPVVKAADAPKSLTLSPAVNVKAVTPRGHGGTACGACHSTGGWSQVRFNHDATGFLLKGQHARVSCKQCHVTTFDAPVPRGCSGCHVDAHGGDLGQRCESCHDERTWESEQSPEAHRRTNFPLLGGHAALPCLECHADARERKFTRAAVACVGCHQGDVMKTTGTGIDHARLGFGNDCLSCHSAIRFKPARFVTPTFSHDSCFVITSGAHSAVTCEQCHGLGIPLSASNACASRTVSCSGCHTHQCAGPQGTLPTDALHAQVQGYQCRDAKCAECHQAMINGP